MSRLPSHLRRLQYRILVLRDKGERCFRCDVDREKEKEIELTIHHLDGNKENNAESNLKLACKSCQMKEYHERKASKSASGEWYEKESERTGRGVDEAVGQPSSEELRVNREKRPKWLLWVWEKCMAECSIEVKRAVYEGAKGADLSSVTTRRYLQEEITDEGSLQLLEGYGGNPPRVCIKPSKEIELRGSQNDP